MAQCRNQSAWRRAQNCGDAVKTRASRSAESASMARLPNTISFIQLQEFAKRHRRPEPARLPLIVFDRNFVGMSVLPSTRDAELFVHAHAVLTAHLKTERLHLEAVGAIGSFSTSTGPTRIQSGLRPDRDSRPTPLRPSPQLRHSAVSRRWRHAAGQGRTRTQRSPSTPYSLGGLHASAASC